MATYFKTSVHLANFIKKRVRENPSVIDGSELLPLPAYIEALFSSQLADEFGVALLSDSTLLEEENFLKWMQENKVAGWSIDEEIANLLTSEFKDTLGTLVRKPGIYSFWSEKKCPLYIGMSVDIGRRASTSFNDHFRNYNRNIWFRYYITKTGSDAAVLEVCFITILKPAFNKSSKFRDILTFDVPFLPKLSIPVLCNNDERAETDAKPR